MKTSRIIQCTFDQAYNISVVCSLQGAYHVQFVPTPTKAAINTFSESRLDHISCEQQKLFCRLSHLQYACTIIL